MKMITNSTGDMNMFELKTREKIFYSKNGKPKSVLVDYKVYK